MDPNPYAPPTAAVADVPVADGAPAGLRRMRKRVRALQLLGIAFICLVGLSVVRLAGWAFLRGGGGSMTTTLLAMAWHSAVCLYAITTVVALQRRARFARGLVHGLFVYTLATLAVVAIYNLADPRDNGYALFFAVLLLGLWYVGCWSQKARAFFAS